MHISDLPWPFLQKLASLSAASLSEIAGHLRDAIFPYFGCSALVIFTEECTGRPQKKAGQEKLTARISIAELEEIRAGLIDDKPWLGQAALAEDTHSVLALKDSSSNALLVLVDPIPSAADSDALVAVVQYLWQIAAQRIQEKVTDAQPAYLLESRASSTERIRVTAQLTDLHSTTLEILLAALRSPNLDDATARSTATGLAAKAIVELRNLNDRTAELVEEPVMGAFARLREELSPLSKFGEIRVEFVDPPLTGRALPGEIAYGARAIVRDLLLAMIEQPKISKIRTQWDCDGDNLLINMRDDGDGALSASDPGIARIERRVQALDGELQIDIMPGWGSDVVVTLPLDPRVAQTGDFAIWNLADRELEVLQHLLAGDRNRAIASKLRISENTVKFHVRNVFKKLGVSSRSEAIAFAHRHGLR